MAAAGDVIVVEQRTGIGLAQRHLFDRGQGARHCRRHRRRAGARFDEARGLGFPIYAGQPQ
jgi:hypothetical protein